MMRDDDVEKGLLTGVVGKHGLKGGNGAFHGMAEDDNEQRHRLCCERRRRTWRLLIVAMVGFCVCFSVVHLERRSLIDMGGQSHWTTTARPSSTAAAEQASKAEYIHTPAASSSSVPEHTVLDTVHHTTKKPSGRPIGSPKKPVPFWQKGVQKPDASHEGKKLYRPTAALKNLAHALHQAIPKPAWLGHWTGAKPVPTHADQVYLLFSAARHATYRFPADAKARLAQIKPATQTAFTHMLRTVMPAGTEETDARMYVSHHDDWLSTHHNASRLTVFSKSYCPYSRKAKALLTSLGAHFDVHEVDLREDAAALQSALREISGHRTFPAVFLGDELLGGSDDLAQLHATDALVDKLKAGGVQLDAPQPTPGRRDDDSF